MIINFKKDDIYWNFKSTDGKFWLCRKHLLKEHPELKSQTKFAVEISFRKRKYFRTAKVDMIFQNPSLTFPNAGLIFEKSDTRRTISSETYYNLLKLGAKLDKPFWYRIITS